MKRKSLLLKMMASYILIFSIPVLFLSMWINYRLAAGQKEQLGQMMQSSLSVKKELNDSLWSDIKRTAISIMYSDDLAGLRRATSKVERLFAGKRLMSNLSVNQLTNELIDSIYVYTQDDGQMYTSYDNLYESGEFHDMDWLEMSGGETCILEHRQVRKPDSGWAEPGVDCITYVYRMEGYSCPQGYIVFNVNKHRLYQKLGKGDADSEFYILNAQGLVIVAGDRSRLNQTLEVGLHQLLMKEGSERRSFQYDSDGRNLYVAELKSHDEWNYVEIYDGNQLQQNIISNGILILALCLAIILLGIPFCILVSKKIYRPIQDLVADIQNSGSFAQNVTANEMEVISNAFSTIRRENTISALLFEKNRKKITANNTHSLLLGNVSEDIRGSELYRTLNEHQNAVVLISIDEPYFKSRYTGIAGEMNEIISKIGESSFGDSYDIYPALINQHLISMVVSFTLPEQYSALAETLAGVKEIVSQLLNFTVSIAYSGYRKGAEDLFLCYEEATEALRWKLVFGRDSIIRFHPYMTDETQWVFFYPKDTIGRVLNALEQEDSQRLHDMLDTLFCQIAEAKASIDNIRLIYYQIIGQLVQFMLSRGVMPSNLFNNETDLYRHISRLETIESINLWIKNLFSMILNYCIHQKDSKREYIQRFKKYLGTHYREDLYPEEVAQTIGISYSYLRKLLSSELDTNFVDYLNRLRIEEAKHLLRHTDKPVKEIAAAVGYANEQSFTRAFKKIAETTPGKYRRIMQD